MGLFSLAVWGPTPEEQSVPFRKTPGWLKAADLLLRFSMAGFMCKFAWVAFICACSPPARGSLNFAQSSPRRILGGGGRGRSRSKFAPPNLFGRASPKQKRSHAKRCLTSKAPKGEILTTKSSEPRKKHLEPGGFPGQG